MKKILKFSKFLIFSSLFLFCACSKTNQSVEISGEYSANLVGKDWGAGINEILITLDQEVENVSKNTFIVKEKKEFFDWQKPESGMNQIESERTIEQAFLSDDKGNKIKGSSKYIVVKMLHSPKEGSYFVLTPDTPFVEYPELYELNISLAEDNDFKTKEKKVSKVNIEAKMNKLKTKAVESFGVDEFEASDGIEYKYASFEPKDKSDTLVVWLHGLAEGGTEKTDPYSAVLGNKVTALIGDEFQNVISGANILVPQSPTFWMDGNGKAEMEGFRIINDGTSYYRESLHELINYYKESTKSSKVIIAGCSNGGYMGMELALTYGNEYDSYVLICEAMEDKFISDEKINELKDVPLFFIYSNDDPLVDPEVYEKPTIKRLKEAGASNIQVATFDEIVDTSGKYKDEKGNPYNFGGHSSWIPFFNNEVRSDESGISAWEWMKSTIEY